MSQHSGHVVSVKFYSLIFILLVVLAMLTTGMAFVDLGAFNTVVALVIAFTKATLVALFFMHLRWSPALQRIVGVAALLWLAILIALTLSDYLTRGWIPAPGSWESSLNFTRDFVASLLGWS